MQRQLRARCKEVRFSHSLVTYFIATASYTRDGTCNQTITVILKLLGFDDFTVVRINLLTFLFIIPCFSNRVTNVSEYGGITFLRNFGHYLWN